MITHMDKLHDLQCDPSECLAGQDTRGLSSQEGDKLPGSARLQHRPAETGLAGECSPGKGRHTPQADSQLQGSRCSDLGQPSQQPSGSLGTRCCVSERKGSMPEVSLLGGTLE